MTPAETLARMSAIMPGAGWHLVGDHVVSIASILLPTGVSLPIGAVILDGTHVVLAVRPAGSRGRGRNVALLDIDGVFVSWPCEIVPEGVDLCEAIDTCFAAIGRLAGAWYRKYGVAVEVDA